MTAPRHEPKLDSDPAAQALAHVHRGWDHLRKDRPLAAWASWRQALRIEPAQRAATEALALLAIAPELPASARKEWRFRAPGRGDDARRARWDQSFAGRDLADLEHAAAAFAQIQDPDGDADAAFNQGLCLAWLGRNGEAVDALTRAVDGLAAVDFAAAAAAGLLAEILRQGAGHEPIAEAWTETVEVHGLADPAAILEAIDYLATLRRLPPPIDPAVDPARASLVVGVVELLDRPIPEPDDQTDADPIRLEEVPRVDAVVLALPGGLRFSSVRSEGVLAVAELLEDLELPRPTPVRSPLPLALLDVPIWTIRPPDWLDDEERRRLYRETVEDFYENRWPARRGWLGLGSASPRSPGETARIEAAIRLREELAARPSVAALYQGYPFDRLRHRLGLDPVHPAAVDPVEIPFMTAAELDAVDPATLRDDSLEDALRSSLPFGDDARSARFAAELVRRSPTSLRRLGVIEAFGPIVREAIRVGAPGEAGLRIDEAIAADQAYGRGWGRSTLEFWRFEDLVRRGEADRAVEVYAAIARDRPDFPSASVTALLEAGCIPQARRLLTVVLEAARDRDDHASIRRLAADLAAFDFENPPQA